MADKLVPLVEKYFARLRDEHGLGAGTKERSYYPALTELLNALGGTLKPKVLCLSDLGNTGAGHPDFGLFAANQVQKGEPRKGQQPERGVIEMKGVADDAWMTAATGQVSKYVDAYRLVIVTNLRSFLIVGEGPDGAATKLESFSLAPDAKTFWSMVATPRKSAEAVGDAFAEFLKRALIQSVALREPKDVAWFLASYARDALHRVEAAGDLEALANVRGSLEQALGVRFEKKEGDRFFRSTLVQTLFYGVFSAWVLWARQTQQPAARFDWRTAMWHLKVPFISALFQQIASPQQLQPLKLVEVLDWTAAALNRIDSAAFFKRFNDADAVQFFYEPFLEAFDPALRKELGVWYTPTEVVDYMVARVDKALRDDLGVADGLASDQVYILDPCCGTGAFLSAVLRRIDATLEDRGLGGLRGQMVKKAALTRVFGFEIMPAPFVVAHLQVGLVLQGLGASLDADSERAGVYLTNALTGWEPVVAKPMPFPEFEVERKLADRVKQEAPILVILGNPPYNGYAGMAVEEERALSTAYRTVKKVRKPEGQGLNDLYVRFFRMAERRIADKTGRGVISFISNYSWLDGLSFPGMRERYLEAFDSIRIDRLNGDKYKTGKLTPAGEPDPSIFSTSHSREGIQVGTAIATLIRRTPHCSSDSIQIRDLWGSHKREQLLATANSSPESLYQRLDPCVQFGLPFAHVKHADGYLDWPLLTDIIPVSFPGVKTSRDDFLVSIDKDALVRRLQVYFDKMNSDDSVRSQFNTVMARSANFDGGRARQALLSKGLRADRVVRFAYRPLDVRWLYWEEGEGLVDRARSEIRPHLVSQNLFLSSGARNRKEQFYQPQVVSALSDHHLVESNVTMFPLFLDHGDGLQRHNLPPALASWIAERGMSASAVFFHAVATLSAPNYCQENSGALRMDWPRIPLPSDVSTLSKSENLGRRLSALLDSETAIQGVSTGKLRAGLCKLAIPVRKDGQSLAATDLSISANWGYVQIERDTGAPKIMPGGGLYSERAYSEPERAAFRAEALAYQTADHAVVQLLGEHTVDVHLNAEAFWRNVPNKVWEYNLGGYQVLKKWLSYRDQEVLGRPLRPDEVAYFSEMVRRIAAILLMGPQLDANYAAAKADAVEWKDGKPVGRGG